IEMLEDYRDENSEILIEETLRSDLYFQNEKEKIGLNWILGKTADFPFNQLNNFERTLISLYDYKGMTYEEVGAQMGYHRDTIWNKRKQIKKKLEEIMKNPPCD
ncbi:sigma factor-like helix-turn-helix DNA-binding protein, partial [Bacillus thuringiensis]|nr:sigma factor-like helix-turn-helix DNA-binding protein [Bacillus thuringiensis]